MPQDLASEAHKPLALFVFVIIILVFSCCYLTTITPRAPAAQLVYSKHCLDWWLALALLVCYLYGSRNVLVFSDWFDYILILIINRRSAALGKHKQFDVNFVWSLLFLFYAAFSLAKISSLKHKHSCGMVPSFSFVPFCLQFWSLVVGKTEALLPAINNWRIVPLANGLLYDFWIIHAELIK